METLELRRRPHLHALTRINHFRQVERIRYPEDIEGKERVIAFLDQVLRPAADFSIEQEYPSLFGAFPGGVSLALNVGGKIVSHVALMVREYQIEGLRLKIGLIGSVATSAHYQGRGFASSLLEEAVAELKRRGCAVAVLWSDRTDFYTRQGFIRAGQEIGFRLEVDSGGEIPNPPREVDRKRDLPFLWRLYLRQRGRIDRSLEEFRQLLQIPRVRAFVTEEKGTLSSYIILNKGADFHDYIHEWVGQGHALIRNIAWVQKNHYPNRNLTLIAPYFTDLQAIRTLSAREWRGVLGLMKVLDRTQLMRTYGDFLRQKQISFRWNDAHTGAFIGGNEVSLETDEDYLKVVFGDQSSETDTIFPFFLWGFDSV